MITVIIGVFCVNVLVVVFVGAAKSFGQFSELEKRK